MLSSPYSVGIDHGSPDGDATVLTRTKRVGDRVVILETVVVPAAPLGSYLGRLLSADVRLLCLNVWCADGLIRRIQRGRFVHAHKGRSPKRGWPGRHAR